MTRQLKECAVKEMTQGNLDMHVNNFISEEGDWDWDCLQQLLPNHFCDIISRIKPLNANAGEDQVYCNHTNEGNFILGSAYEMLGEGNW